MGAEVIETEDIGVDSRAAFGIAFAALRFDPASGPLWRTVRRDVGGRSLRCPALRERTDADRQETSNSWCFSVSWIEHGTRRASWWGQGATEVQSDAVEGETPS